jgi:hypothetical protein
MVSQPSSARSDRRPGEAGAAAIARQAAACPLYRAAIRLAALDVPGVLVAAERYHPPEMCPAVRRLPRPVRFGDILRDDW